MKGTDAFKQVKEQTSLMVVMHNIDGSLKMTTVDKTINEQLDVIEQNIEAVKIIAETIGFSRLIDEIEHLITSEQYNLLKKVFTQYEHTQEN